MDILLPVISVLFGLIILIKSAEIFCDSSVNLAFLLKVPVILVSLTLVPLGTSAPELGVSAIASFHEQGSMAYGNIIGSNIANLAVTFIIMGLFFPAFVHHSFRNLELPALFCFYLLLGFFLLDYKLSQMEGVALLISLGAYLLYLYKNIGKADKPQEEEQAPHKYNNTALVLAIMLVSLIFILASAEALVWGGTQLARMAGVSELFISLTLLAVATSLPEIVVSVVAAKKKQYDLAIANVLGSNLYNVTLILGISASISSINLDPIAVWRDYSFVFMVLMAFIVVLYFYRNAPKQANKITAALMLLIYTPYLILLVAFTG